METHQQTPVAVGQGMKKWWIAIIILSSYGVAWAIYYNFSTSTQSYSVAVSSAMNTSLGKGIHKRKENISQIKETSFGVGLHQNCSRYVSVGAVYSKGLGNRMFYFAAALYVAELTGREVVLFGSHSVKTLAADFDLNVKISKDVCPKYNFKEATYSFDPRLEEAVLNNSKVTNKTIVINGYFHSWKYLEFIKDRIRHHFYFRANTRKVARHFLKSKIPPGWTKGFVRVGIHNRRGDFLGLAQRGFGVGTEAYFQKAMKYFVQAYGRIQFIVVSMDRKWSQNFIYFNDSAVANITFAFGHTAIEDIAILSMCDHVIVSTGSFGWWAGWLSGGSTTYYANHPIRNSSLSLLLKREDYYPTNWIPLEKQVFLQIVLHIRCS